MLAWGAVANRWVKHIILIIMTRVQEHPYHKIQSENMRPLLVSKTNLKACLWPWIARYNL